MLLREITLDHKDNGKYNGQNLTVSTLSE